MAVLQASTSISANGTSSALFIANAHELNVFVNVSAVPTGGTPTLDVYLQYSDDGGTTWQDIAHLAQITNATVKNYIAISGYITGGAAPIAASDAALAANTVVQGPFGDNIRLKWVFVAGGSSGSYTLAAWAIPKG